MKFKIWSWSAFFCLALEQFVNAPREKYPGYCTAHDLI